MTVSNSIVTKASTTDNHPLLADAIALVQWANAINAKMFKPEIGLESDAQDELAEAADCLIKVSEALTKFWSRAYVRPTGGWEGMLKMPRLAESLAMDDTPTTDDAGGVVARVGCASRA